MSLRWIHDVFGNSVAIATFDERAETLSFVSTSTVEHNPAEEFALTADDPAYFYPFLYDTGISPISCSSSRRNMAIPAASCRRGRAISSMRRGRPPLSISSAT